MMYQNPMPQPPMQAMADQMAQQGRFGDSMMVHMNPIEVAGIASLSPTGQLTTNPMTGQPEAFLPFLAPLLGSLAGSTFLTGSTLGGILGSGLSSAAAGAIGSGLATTAVTGDIKEGLLSGLTGFGIGKALGAGLDSAKGAAEAAAAVDAAKEGVAEATKLAGQTTKEALKSGVPADTLAQLKADPASFTNVMDLTPPAQAALDASQALPTARDTLSAARSGYSETIRNMPVGERLGAMFSGETAKAALSPGVIAPIAIGEGQRAAMAAQDERDRMFGRRAAEREEELDRMTGIRDASIRQVGSDYGIDYSREYGTRYAAQGGITSVDPDDFQRRMMELQMMGREPIQMNGGGPSNPDVMIRPFPGIMTGSAAGGFGAPAGRQSRIRGPEVIKPEDLVGTRPGFQPEISYFRAPTRDEAASSLEKITGVNTSVVPINPDMYQGIGAVGKGGVSGARTLPAKIQEAMDVLNRKSVSTRKRKAAQARVDAYEKEQDSNRDYFDSVLASTYGTEYGMQGGGETEMTQQDAMRLIEQVSMALLGRLSEEESEAVINRFIDEFGSEAFQMLRSQVLESVVPDSQKEGVIRGQGGGMDDEIPGMIGDSQPVAVSPGEFIVPADVVSGIGDGDTNAGVQELEGMMDRVRQERTGTTKQPAPLGAMAGGAIPA